MKKQTISLNKKELNKVLQEITNTIVLHDSIRSLAEIKKIIYKAGFRPQIKD